MINLNDYKGRRVLVTGAKGFVGKHLCRRLADLDAQVYGFDIGYGLANELGEPYDLRLASSVLDSVKYCDPHFIFHLGAQAFVPRGYDDPQDTWNTNVMGTVNVLEAARWLNRPCSVVVVTTDKVYGDTGSPQDFDPSADEFSPLRGLCPYSASKVAAERVVESYRESFWKKNGPVRVATARAGNIIGPGDHFGVGRLVPNAIEALRMGKPVPVFNPQAVRPWQYVGDVVDGYLRLGIALEKGNVDDPFPAGRTPEAFCGPFNFGPEEHHTVREVVDEVIKAWGSGISAYVQSELREVQHLRIDSSKARRMLGWQQAYSFKEMIAETVAWEKEHAEERKVGVR